MTTVGLAIIARDEESNLLNLLTSVGGAFDQIVLVDTGSTDRTVEVFEAWCEAVGQEYRLGHFAWCDDFSAARNYADSLLSTDWKAWGDCDDTIFGAEHLRQVVDAVPAEVSCLAADYLYAPELVLPRERIMRAGMGAWSGRVDEMRLISEGSALCLPRELVRWIHHADEEHLAQSRERDRRIRERWFREEPDHPLFAAKMAALEWLGEDVELER